MIKLDTYFETELTIFNVCESTSWTRCLLFLFHILTILRVKSQVQTVLVVDPNDKMTNKYTVDFILIV
jgi:hypothetical protein